MWPRLPSPAGVLFPPIALSYGWRYAHRHSIFCTGPEQVADRLFQGGALGFVTPRQLEILIAVAADEGCNLTAIKERTGIDRSTATELVQRLVRKALLQKRRSRQTHAPSH